MVAIPVVIPTPIPTHRRAATTPQSRARPTLCLAAVAIFIALSSLSHAQADQPLPYTYLFDTRTPSANPLTPAQMKTRIGWTIVPEDNVTHKFRGDAVFMNDRIVVVLRKSGRGAEVYARTAKRIERRATLIPQAVGTSDAAVLSAIDIIENNPSAVALNAALKTEDGKRVSVGWRLTTGQLCVELSPGEGMGKLLVEAQIRYTVVPDYFGDDMVFGPKSFDLTRVGLPTENILLNMIEGCDAVVMCVWQSNRQNAALLLSREGGERLISGVEIECVKDKNVWVAFLESPNIWHETTPPVNWRPPFPAKWRASSVGDEGVAKSWTLTERHRPESGMRGKTAIVYPIDRSRATPLTAFCPTDIMRNTLGVGPCQYLLEMEGLASASYPTPDQVTRWVERQFKRKRAKRTSAEIRERFEQMAAHIRRARSRIQGYRDFARDVRKLCVKEAQANPATSQTAAKFRAIAEDMERTIAASQKKATPGSTAQLANGIVALIGQKNALDDCQTLGAQIRTIGAAQDRTLSKCRMATRRLKQQSMMLAAKEPTAADFAAKVRRRAQQMLQSPITNDK